MKVASTASADEKVEHKLNANIPKSPSFHSGLDLVAGAGNKYVNISKFNFANDMNGNNNKTTAADQQPNQQTIFSFTKVRIFLTLEICRCLQLSRLFSFTVFYAIKSIEQFEHNIKYSTDSPASKLCSNSAPSLSIAKSIEWRFLQAKQCQQNCCAIKPFFPPSYTVDCW